MNSAVFCISLSVCMSAVYLGASVETVEQAEDEGETETDVTPETETRDDESEETSLEAEVHIRYLK